MKAIIVLKGWWRTS
ncbi:TPA: trp operon leader peptide [Escherichia coli]|nr:trp operon leader peptide [Escherichia coli]